MSVINIPPGDPAPYVRTPRVDSAVDMKIMREVAEHLFDTVSSIHPKPATASFSFRADSNRSERFVWIDINVWPKGNSASGVYIQLPSVKLSGIRPDGRPRFYFGNRSLGLAEIDKVFFDAVNSSQSVQLGVE